MKATYTIRDESGETKTITRATRIAPHAEPAVRAAEVVERSGALPVAPGGDRLTGVASVVEIVKTTRRNGTEKTDRHELYTSPAEKARRDEEARRHSIEWDHAYRTSNFLEALEDIESNVAYYLERLTNARERLIAQAIELPDEGYERHATRRGTMKPDTRVSNVLNETITQIQNLTNNIRIDRLVYAAGELSDALRAVRELRDETAD